MSDDDDFVQALFATGQALVNEQLRSESAEERYDDLVAKLRALADEWAADVDSLPRAWGCAARLRALLPEEAP